MTQRIGLCNLFAATRIGKGVVRPRAVIRACLGYWVLYDDVS